MSLEKIFQRGSSAFLFVFWALFAVWYGVSGSVFAVFAWCSMLLKGTINVVNRDV